MPNAIFKYVACVAYRNWPDGPAVYRYELNEDRHGIDCCIEGATFDTQAEAEALLMNWRAGHVDMWPDHYIDCVTHVMHKDVTSRVVDTLKFYTDIVNSLRMQLGMDEIPV